MVNIHTPCGHPIDLNNDCPVCYAAALCIEIETLKAEQVAAGERSRQLFEAADRRTEGLEKVLERIRRRCETDPSNLPARMLAGEVVAMVIAALSKSRGG